VDSSIADTTDYCFKSTYNSNSQNFDINVNSCLTENYRCRNIPNKLLWSTSQANTVACTQAIDSAGRELVTPGSLAPGEICISNDECYSKVCDDSQYISLIYEYKFCLGKLENQACSTSLDCNVLLYCDDTYKVCLKQKFASRPCKVSEECKNNSECYNGICTGLWSLPSGTPIEDANSIFCKSSFVYNGMCQDFKLIVNEKLSNITFSDPNRNKDGLPNQKVDCTENENCMYYLPLKNDIITLNAGFCNCGYNENGKAYCKLGSDSITYNDLILERMKILGFNQTSSLTQNELLATCHVTKKLSCNKIKIKEFQNIKSLEYALEGSFELADRCVRLYYSNGNYLSTMSIMLVYMILFGLLL